MITVYQLIAGRIEGAPHKGINEYIILALVAQGIANIQVLTCRGTVVYFDYFTFE